MCDLSVREASSHEAYWQGQTSNHPFLTAKGGCPSHLKYYIDIKLVCAQIKIAIDCQYDKQG